MVMVAGGEGGGGGSGGGSRCRGPQHALLVLLMLLKTADALALRLMKGLCRRRHPPACLRREALLLVVVVSPGINHDRRGGEGGCWRAAASGERVVCVARALLPRCGVLRRVIYKRAYSSALRIGTRCRERNGSSPTKKGGG